DNSSDKAVKDTSGDSNKNDKSEVDSKILEKLPLFKSLELPYTYNPQNPVELKEDHSIKDGAYEGNESFIYGTIKSNGNYVATITFVPADAYLPVLTTYTLEGKKIDQVGLVIGRCGMDCGVTCSEHLYIK